MAGRRATTGRAVATRFWSGLTCLLAVGTAGCATSGPPGSADLAVPPPGPAAPAPVALGAFLQGPVGSRLGEADRQSALKAELDAVSSGDRRTWRGVKGVYGFVEPGAPGAGVAASAPGAAGGCRAFSHTVYFGGRPETGRGTGCRGADGEWRITG